MSLSDALYFLIGYGVALFLETVILLFALSSRHGFGVRLFAGFWLATCTYPLLLCVMPALLDPFHHPFLYATFAVLTTILTQCALFCFAFGSTKGLLQDLAAITFANIVSAGAGMLLKGALSGPWEIVLQ